MAGGRNGHGIGIGGEASDLRLAGIIMSLRLPFLLSLSLLVGSLPLAASDWPQFMHDPARSGAASAGFDPARLGLLRQVELGEMILTAPAVVDGRAYVVDQQGAAYCVEVATGRIVWKQQPEKIPALGGNTSSPAVVDGRVIYGTVGGKLFILRADDGVPLHTVDLGWPCVASVAATPERLYVSTVDSAVHAFSLAGERLWTWDHYQLAQRWPSLHEEDESDRFAQPHFGGAPVCVIGDRVIAPLGYDLVCLRDHGDRAERLWAINQPRTEFDVPLGASSDGNAVYCTWPKSDGQGTVVRHRLEDGKPTGLIRNQWAVLNPPSCVEGRVLVNRHAFGTAELQFDDGRRPVAWQSFGITRETVEPAVSAVAHAGRHCVVTTLGGELLVFERGGGKESSFAPRAPVYRFAVPGAPMITSSPAIADGKILFGADDGCLYVLAEGGAGEPRLVQPSPRVLPASDPVGEWPSAFGGPDNRSLVSDSDFKPPFRLRWAMKSFGLYKHPVCAARGDLLSSSFAGLVVCRDQETGTIHWRRKLPGQAWCRATLLCADGKVFIPRVSSPRYAMIVDQPDVLYALDQASGRVLWRRPIGRSDWLRASPVFAQGVVAYGSKYETPAGSRFLVGPAAEWRVASTAEAGWILPDFDDSAWVRSAVANDGTVLAATPEVTSHDALYLRKAFQLEESLRPEERLTLILGPADEATVSIDGQVVFQTPGWVAGRTAAAAKYRGVAARLEELELNDLAPGRHTIAIGIRRAKVTSNVSGSTSVFPPRLAVVEAGALRGPVIDAWDAESGEPRWRFALPAAGDYIEGPAGCSDGQRMYFTGGGAGEQGRGMTAAFDPTTGERIWETRKAWSCRTGTPAIAGDTLLLPGALFRPLAALDLATGNLRWENEQVRALTMVHAPSVLDGIFTVNTKYVGGSKCWDVASGAPRMVRNPNGSRPLDLAGGGHTCGTILMLSSGFALATTNTGLYCTDIRSGKIVARTPGFASQTCPHPAVAGGRLYYSPQNTGMLYSFESSRSGE